MALLVPLLAKIAVTLRIVLGIALAASHHVWGIQVVRLLTVQNTNGTLHFALLLHPSTGAPHDGISVGTTIRLRCHDETDSEPARLCFSLRATGTETKKESDRTDGRRKQGRGSGHTDSLTAICVGVKRIRMLR